MIDERYFHIVYQHFEEGLFNKTLSMEQATKLAYLIMAHVPKVLQKQVTFNQPPRELPAPAKVIEGEYLP